MSRPLRATTSVTLLTRGVRLFNPFASTIIVEPSGVPMVVLVLFFKEVDD